jgi:hypothetical protein
MIPILESYREPIKLGSSYVFIDLGSRRRSCGSGSDDIYIRQDHVQPIISLSVPTINKK